MQMRVGWRTTLLSDRSAACGSRSVSGGGAVSGVPRARVRPGPVPDLATVIDWSVGRARGVCRVSSTWLDFEYSHLTPPWPYAGPRVVSVRCQMPPSQPPPMDHSVELARPQPSKPRLLRDTSHAELVGPGSAACCVPAGFSVELAAAAAGGAGSSACPSALPRFQRITSRAAFRGSSGRRRCCVSASAPASIAMHALGREVSCSLIRSCCFTVHCPVARARGRRLRLLAGVVLHHARAVCRVVPGCVFARDALSQVEDRAQDVRGRWPRRARWSADARDRGRRCCLLPGARCCCTSSRRCHASSLGCVLAGCVLRSSLSPRVAPQTA